MRIIGDAAVHQQHIVEASTNAYDYMRDLETEVARLREALQEFGQHTERCGVHTFHRPSHSFGECNCGLGAALEGEEL